MFRRQRSKHGTSEPETADSSGPDASPSVDASGGQGPWDVADRDVIEDTAYADLGPLKVPHVDGHDLRLQIDEKSGTVIACLLAGADSGADLRVFAAPRSGGLWPEILEQIETEAREAGAETDQRDGDLGRELILTARQTRSDGTEQTNVSRVVGVEGPRWMLRVTFMGDLAKRPDSDSALEQAVRRVVVDRGAEPMSPRDLLPLTRPAESS